MHVFFLISWQFAFCLPAACTSFPQERRRCWLQGHGAERRPHTHVHTAARYGQKQLEALVVLERLLSESVIFACNTFCHGVFFNSTTEGHQSLKIVTVQNMKPFFRCFFLVRSQKHPAWPFAFCSAWKRRRVICIQVLHGIYSQPVESLEMFDFCTAGHSLCVLLRSSTKVQRNLYAMLCLMITLRSTPHNYCQHQSTAKRKQGLCFHNVHAIPGGAGGVFHVVIHGKRQHKLHTVRGCVWCGMNDYRTIMSLVFQGVWCGLERRPSQMWWQWKWWICLSQERRLSWKESLAKRPVNVKPESRQLFSSIKYHCGYICSVLSITLSRHSVWERQLW